jgi:hypothetical protein
MAIAMASLMGPNSSPTTPAPTLIVVPKPDLKAEAALRVKTTFKQASLEGKKPGNNRAI